MRTFIPSVGIEHIIISSLILATLSLFTVAPRYHVETRNLLGTSGFNERSDNWKKSSNCGELTQKIDQALLKNPVVPCTIFLRQSLPVPQNVNQLLLSAEVNTNNVSSGKLSWHTARLSFVGVDKNGKKMWHYPHTVKLPLNSKKWRHVSQIFYIPPDAIELVVGLEIMETTGTLSVRNAKLAQAFENSWFPYAIYTLMVLWGTTLLWLGIKILKLFSSKKMQGLFFIFSGAIAVGCIIPGEVQNQILGPIQATISQLILIASESNLWPYMPLDIQPDRSLTSVFLGHFILFTILAFILRIGRPHDQLASQFFNLLLFAASTEVWQFFTADRQPAVSDWLIDTSGLLLGFFMAGLLNYLRLKPQAL